MANKHIHFRDIEGNSVLVETVDIGGGLQALTTAAGGGGAESSVVVPQASALQAVSTTVLRVLGATNWTLATANGAVRRFVHLANMDASNKAYFAYVAVGASLTGAVSPTDWDFWIAPEGFAHWVEVPAGFDLCVVRLAGSGNVRAREWLFA